MQIYIYKKREAVFIFMETTQTNTTEILNIVL